MDSTILNGGLPFWHPDATGNWRKHSFAFVCEDDDPPIPTGVSCASARWLVPPAPKPGALVFERSGPSLAG